MKKKLCVALVAMVLTAGFAACQEEVPPYLVIEDVDEVIDGEDEEDEDIHIHGKVVMGVTDPAEVPAHVKIPNGIVGIVGFKNCTSLVSITIPKSVTIIGDEAFKGCTSLESVAIPKSMTIIGHEAFRGCTSLASVTIPEGVTEIYEGTFTGCKSLKNVTIPKSVKKIDVGAFNSCIRIEEVTYKGDLKDWCSSSWDYVLLGYAKSTTLSDGTDLKKLTKIDAGDLKGVTSIGERAFSHCKSLVSVTIPDGVMKIDGFAFFGCTSLASVTISRGVTEIEYSAFENCRSLANVVIPHSVKEIGDGAFSKCSPDLEIQYDGTKAQWESIRGYGKPKATVHCTDGVVTEK